MAKRTGEGYLKGQTRKRSQCYNPKTDTHTVRDTDTGQFTRGGKKSPYKNVRKE
jgi:hypothetical protein